MPRAAAAHVPGSEMHVHPRAGLMLSALPLSPPGRAAWPVPAPALLTPYVSKASCISACHSMCPKIPVSKHLSLCALPHPKGATSRWGPPASVTVGTGAILSSWAPSLGQVELSVFPASRAFWCFLVATGTAVGASQILWRLRVTSLGGPHLGPQVVSELHC